MNYLDELKSLSLPEGEFAIFGSGPMGVRDIREARDIDIIVKESLWESLSEKYSGSLHDDPVRLEIGNIEIYKDWRYIDNVNELIDNSEIIDDLPFVKLKYVLEWKTKFGREKDIRDIELIKEYLKN